MLAVTLANGFLCLVAIICAAHVPGEQRGAALSCALIVLANWLLYVLPWSWQLIGVNLAPSTAINHALGWKLTDVDVWAISDTLAAGLMLALAAQTWWGAVLWGLFTAQLVQHVLYSSEMVGYVAYSNGLNGLFLAVVSVFILIGGKGTKDHATHWIASHLPMLGVHSMGNSVHRARQKEIDHGS